MLALVGSKEQMGGLQQQQLGWTRCFPLSPVLPHGHMHPLLVPE
jgi:hypothetical protein